MFHSIASEIGAIVPHGEGWLGKSGLEFARAAADAGIATCCFSMSAGLVLVLRLRDDLYYRKVLALFAALTFSYGAARAFDVLAVWTQIQTILTVSRVVTAGIAAYTALELGAAISRALSAPGPAELSLANEDLERRNAEFARVNAELKATRAELERRVAERTAELSASHERLEAREAYYRALYQKTPIMTHAIDRNGIVVEINEFWANKMGYTPEEAIGRRASEFAAPEPSADPRRSSREALFATGACDRLRFTVFAKDGSTFETEVSGVIHSDGEMERAFLVSVDVTEREAAERQLRMKADELSRINARLAEREAHYRRLFRITPVMMHTLDREGRMQEVNDFWASKMGYSPDEVIGRRGQDFAVEQPPPDDQVRLRSELWATGSWDRVPYTLKRKDGGTFEVEFSAVIHGEGSEARAFLVGVDVTEREAAERRLKSNAAELERANEGLSRFAYVASHDLQEPLRKIIAFSNVLSRALAANDSADVEYAVSVMRDSATRARQLVADLLAYSRSANAELSLASVDVGELARSILVDLSEPIQHAGAELELDLAPLRIEADRTQLGQVLQNLISNALKYRKPGARPSVRVRALAEPDGSARIEVSDDGIGFEAGYASVVFEPFKRLHTRGEYPGSGIGLAICKSICDRHGWSISARATPGEGATFRIAIPGGSAKRSEAG